jgi:hypothetical protein
MADQGGTGGKFNISFAGNVTSSQFVTGDYNHVTQTIGMSPDDVAALKSVFDDLRGAVASDVPPEHQQEALAEVGELEKALVAKQPDPGRVRKALQWFRAHAPQLVGTVASVVINPLVGKVVEGAGEAVAKAVRDAVQSD